MTQRWVHLASKIREVQETGQLKCGPTAEQLAARQALLMELPPRFAVVKRPGSPALFIRTRDVPDAFTSAQALSRSVEWVKKMMLQLHDYVMVPDLSPDREDERIRDFLAQGPLSGDAAEQWSPAPDDVPTPLDI